MRGAATRPALSLVALALALTLLNAAKPLTIDDVSYWLHARQIAVHPLDPFGGRIIFDGVAMRMLHNIAPPGLPIWLAGAMRLLGDEPLALKLSLLPIAALLAAATWWLLRRFAPRHALLLTWVALLSPGVLPGFNLMLDVPALALIAASVALLVAAVDRGAWPLALAAGLAGVLAIETKWTGLSAPLVMLAYAATQRRLAVGVVAASLALGGFALAEALVAWRYGECQFLLGLAGHHGGTQLARLPGLLLDLPIQIGGTAPALAPLAVAALGGGRRAVLLAAAAGLLVLALVALAPSWSPPVRVGVPPMALELPHALAFALLGLLPLLALPVALRRACRRARSDRELAFLLLWAVIEIGSYLAITPFSATRRVLGSDLALLLLLARMLPEGRLPAAPAVAAAAIALALATWTVDRHDARSAERAVREAVSWIDGQGAAGGRRWALGSWGFHYYAARAGLAIVASGEARLEPGDWLIVSEDSAVGTAVALDPAAVSRVAGWAAGSAWPIATMITYYAGLAPLAHADGRTAVTIYRVVKATVPGSR